jgi:hypothetical protein
MSDLAYRDLFVSGSRKENTNQIETAPESVAYNNYTNNSEKNNKVDNNVIFKYLEGDSLSLDVLYQRNLTLNYNLHLCVYEIDQTARLPFIKYLFMNEKKEAFFPIIPLDMESMNAILSSPMQGGNVDSTEDIKYNGQISRDEESIVSTAVVSVINNKAATHIEDVANESESDSDDNDLIKGSIDNEFLKQIKDSLQEVYNLTLIPETMYRGFLEKDSNIFVFIDATNEQYTRPPYSEYGMIDEILNAGYIKDIKIRHYIHELFKSNKILQNIKTIEEIFVQFPKIGYISNVQDNQHYNIFKQPENKTYLILPPTTRYENEDLYLFSSVPITIGNLENVRRYACFIENIEPQDTQNKDQDNFSFEENNIHFYALREVDLFVEL